MIDVIFLDIDGVLANWNDAAIAAHRLDVAKVNADWDELRPRPWDLSVVLGCSPAIANNWRFGDWDFWAELDPYDWCHDLHEACCAVAPTVLLTSPSRAPSSHSGKAVWIQRHFGSRFRDYLIGAPKHRCARSGAVLIDDAPKNCKAFRDHGEESILFPGVGNTLHRMPTADRVDHVKAELAVRRE